MSGDYVIKLRI